MEGRGHTYLTVEIIPTLLKLANKVAITSVECKLVAVICPSMSCSVNVSSGAASAAHYQNLSIDNFNQHTGRNDRASMPLYM